MTMHIYTPNQYVYQVSTSYTLQFLRYNPDKIFKLKVTTARSKGKSRSDYDVAHLHSQTNVPSKFFNFLHLMVSDIAWTRFFELKVPIARSKLKSR